jgi:GntR family transcriptional regulator
MIKIDTSSFIPMYEQIKMQFKHKVALGILKPNDSLPSIRDLATELFINPNTVARAYRELEREGFISTRRGKGCYVSGVSSALFKWERAAILNRIFDEAIQEVRKFELPQKKIMTTFEQRLHKALKAKRQE